MNKLNYHITQLFNELQTLEAILKEKNKEGQANVAEEKPSSSNKNKKKNNNKASFEAQLKKNKRSNMGNNKKNNSKKKKPKGKYFHCRVGRHWK